MKLRSKRLAAVAVFAAALLLLAAPRPAQAQLCTTCDCVNAYHGNIGQKCTTRDIIHEEHDATRDFIDEEFGDWEKFLDETMWKKFLLPAWMMMTEQMATVGMHQMLMLGTMLDAQQQIQTEREFARLTLEAHRDYHPDMTMCVFGTNVRSLAATERNAEFTSYILGQHSLDRQMGNMMSLSARGQYMDHYTRMVAWRDRYCNPHDDNGEFRPLCQSTDKKLMNRDIDFPRMVGENPTLEIDFSDLQEPTDDEKDIFALATNLYATDVQFRLPPVALNSPYNQDEVLDARSVVAKRSVAENTFNTIVGMHAMSSPGTGGAETGKYMKVVMKQLGLTDEKEIAAMIGDRPSYYAQMDILTKKIYQQPDFFVDLVDHPANTKRKKVAMQAIGLMQQFDTWQSYLRTEAILSVVLEMEIMKAQEEVQNRINKLNVRGQLRK
jgi:hypothetical protein